MPLYLEYDASIFIFLFFLSCFFFLFDPKTDHSYFTCHKKLYYSCSGSKTKRKSALMPLYLEYDASIFFFLFFLSCFFFVLTQKPTIHTLLAIKNCIIPALGQKRKKISSDA